LPHTPNRARSEPGRIGRLGNRRAAAVCAGARGHVAARAEKWRLPTLGRVPAGEGARRNPHPTRPSSFFAFLTSGWRTSSGPPDHRTPRWVGGRQAGDSPGCESAIFRSAKPRSRACTRCCPPTGKPLGRGPKRSGFSRATGTTFADTWTGPCHGPGRRDRPPAQRPALVSRHQVRLEKKVGWPAGQRFRFTPGAVPAGTGSGAGHSLGVTEARRRAVSSGRRPGTGSGWSVGWEYGNRDVRGVGCHG